MRELFIKDWGWKLFSLLLAVAIWFTVHRILQESIQSLGASGSSLITYGNLPVDIVSTRADMREYRPLQSAVSVTVSGLPEAIGKLQANQIHAFVTVSDLESVINTKQRIEVSVPAGITVVSITPEAIGVIAPPPPSQ
jgi:YbbR domain-containing protein